MPSTLEIDAVLQDWRRLIDRVPANRRGFVLSILRQQKRQGWMPSDKQWAVMVDLHDRYGPRTIASEWSPIDQEDNPELWSVEWCTFLQKTIQRGATLTAPFEVP